MLNDNMKLLEEDEIVKIEYDENTKLFKHTWNDKTRNITDEEYKKSVLKTIAQFSKLDSKVHLVDSQNFLFTISPDLQLWLASQVFPNLEAMKVEKVAFLVSKDIFAQVSIEQFVEEDKTEAVESRYFDTEKEAMDWLLA